MAAAHAPAKAHLDGRVKLATLQNGHRDGELVVVSRDLRRAASATPIATSLIDAIERWEEVVGPLRELSQRLHESKQAEVFEFDLERVIAPMPRSAQWCDGSAFLNHGNLMARAFNTPRIPDFDTIPLIYQGASDDFLGPYEDVPLPSEADGIDFEGEFGVITGEVPMGADRQVAERSVKLVVQLNDWSLRHCGAREIRTGFGFFHAKPSTSFAPVAVTPDELGAHWSSGRVTLALHVHWNGLWFGRPSGGEMNFSFFDLIVHAAKTRRLRAGTIVGSGTVSNADRSVGSACIAERRVIEIIEQGRAITDFMKFGDEVRMEARDAREETPFGFIQQRVVQRI
jgi:fumarylacetoacetate (FAA) hydrolase